MAEVAAESYACQFDDHPVCSDDESDAGAVVLADTHFKRSGDRSRGLTRSVSPESRGSWRRGVAFCAWLEHTTRSIWEVACVSRTCSTWLAAEFKETSTPTQARTTFLFRTQHTSPPHFPSGTLWFQVYVGTSRGETRETANPGRRRRTFTFGEGTAAPPPHNRTSTPDSESGKKKELQRKGGGKKVPQPAGQ